MLLLEYQEYIIVSKSKQKALVKNLKEHVCGGKRMEKKEVLITLLEVPFI